MSGQYPPPGSGYPFPGYGGPPYAAVPPQTSSGGPGLHGPNVPPAQMSSHYAYNTYTAPNESVIPGPSISSLPYNPNSVYTPYSSMMSPPSSSSSSSTLTPVPTTPHPMAYSGVPAMHSSPSLTHIQQPQLGYGHPVSYTTEPQRIASPPAPSMYSAPPHTMESPSTSYSQPQIASAEPPGAIRHSQSAESLLQAQQNLVSQQRQGIIRVDMKGYYWLVDPERSSKDPVFIAADSLNTAVEGDTAVAQLHNRNDGKLSGVIIKIISRAQPQKSPPETSPASPPRRSSIESIPTFIEGQLSVDSKASIQFTGASPGDHIRVQIQPSTTKTSDGNRVGHVIAIVNKQQQQQQISAPPAPAPAPAPAPGPVRSPSQRSLVDVNREIADVSMQLGMLQFNLQTAQQRGASQVEIDGMTAQQYHLMSLMHQKQAELATLNSAPTSVSNPPPLVLPPGHVAVSPGQPYTSPPVGPSKKAPDFIWSPGMPIYMKLTESERTALKRQFQSIDKDNRGYLGEKELRESLGLVGFDEVLSKLFVRAFDMDNDKMISQDDFMSTMAIFLKGSAVEKMNTAYNMIDFNSTGRVTREDLFRIVNSMYRVLTNMRIPVYESDIHSYVNDLWKVIDVEGTGAVPRETFVSRALEHQNKIIGLGLVNIPLDPPKLPKRGVSVSFGHFYWSLALQMMVGMRLAIDQQRSREEKAVKSVDFTEVKQFEISSNDLTKKYVFTDYAPFVFKRLREMSGIDETSYMFSLGPEQLLGNMMLGNLSSLSMSLSEGKSGSFFFTSHDGRFLVKTISSFEVACLKKMLPHYFQHMATNLNSMLVRIYGFHSINQQTFIVMGNVFSTHLSIDELYDLKGSTVGRTGGQSSVKKDLDFTRTIRLSPENRDLFLQQLNADANFLKQNNVIDYSLLVGIRKMRDEDWREELKYPVLINGKVPFWAQTKGGMRGFNDYGQPGDEIFFVGVIDIFTEYGIIKQAENLFKSLVHGPDRISAIPADRYADRFLRYIASLVR